MAFDAATKSWAAERVTAQRDPSTSDGIYSIDSLYNVLDQEGKGAVEVQQMDARLHTQTLLASNSITSTPFSSRLRKLTGRLGLSEGLDQKVKEMVSDRNVHSCVTPGAMLTIQEYVDPMNRIGNLMVLHNANGQEVYRYYGRGMQAPQDYNSMIQPDACLVPPTQQAPPGAPGILGHPSSTSEIEFNQLQLAGPLDPRQTIAGIPRAKLNAGLYPGFERALDIRSLEMEQISQSISPKYELSSAQLSELADDLGIGGWQNYDNDWYECLSLLDRERPADGQLFYLAHSGAPGVRGGYLVKWLIQKTRDLQSTPAPAKKILDQAIELYNTNNVAPMVRKARTTFHSKAVCMADGWLFTVKYAHPESYLIGQRIHLVNTPGRIMCWHPKHNVWKCEMEPNDELNFEDIDVEDFPACGIIKVSSQKSFALLGRGEGPKGRQNERVKCRLLTCSVENEIIFQNDWPVDFATGSRGHCDVCGHLILTSHPRTLNPDKTYRHRGCKNRATPLKEAKATKAVADTNPKLGQSRVRMVGREAGGEIKLLPDRATAMQEAANDPVTTGGEETRMTANKRHDEHLILGFNQQKGEMQAETETRNPVDPALGRTFDAFQSDFAKSAASESTAKTKAQESSAITATAAPALSSTITPPPATAVTASATATATAATSTAIAALSSASTTPSLAPNQAPLLSVPTHTTSVTTHTPAGGPLVVRAGQNFGGHVAPIDKDSKISTGIDSVQDVRMGIPKNMTGTSNGLVLAAKTAGTDDFWPARILTVEEIRLYRSSGMLLSTFPRQYEEVAIIVFFPAKVDSDFRIQIIKESQLYPVDSVTLNAATQLQASLGLQRERFNKAVSAVQILARYAKFHNLPRDKPKGRLNAKLNKWHLEICKYPDHILESDWAQLVSKEQAGEDIKLAAPEWEWLAPLPSNTMPGWPEERGLPSASVVSQHQAVYPEGVRTGDPTGAVARANRIGWVDQRIRGAELRNSGYQVVQQKVAAAGSRLKATINSGDSRNLPGLVNLGIVPKPVPPGLPGVPRAGWYHLAGPPTQNPYNPSGMLSLESQRTTDQRFQQIQLSASGDSTPAIGSAGLGDKRIHPSVQFHPLPTAKRPRVPSTTPVAFAHGAQTIVGASTTPGVLRSSAAGNQQSRISVDVDQLEMDWKALLVRESVCKTVAQRLHQDFLQRKCKVRDLRVALGNISLTTQQIDLTRNTLSDAIVEAVVSRDLQRACKIARIAGLGFARPELDRISKEAYAIGDDVHASSLADMVRNSC